MGYVPDGTFQMGIRVFKKPWGDEFRQLLVDFLQSLTE